MKRNIITIDEQKCTGCGVCIPNCPEGAIQLIDGKARMVSDLMCDGFGACLGHCPEGAISVIEREAEAYDEEKVMGKIVKQGEGTIRAHLKHLKEHNQIEFYTIAMDYLKKQGLTVYMESLSEYQAHHHGAGGCPGSGVWTMKASEPVVSTGDVSSHLSHWPVQMHLLSPNSPHFRGADMVIAADCTAFSFGNFHEKFLKGKKVGIACPKLDEGTDVYTDKVRALIEVAEINTLTVVVMEVPCCRGLLSLVLKARDSVSRKVPVTCVTIGIEGGIIEEKWV
ncbi:MAG TPA: 4Fe-4S binding protein [Chitinispirillaceae bacterium]|nr:4Fe-4S binding protein [Chitinispirillaceae bacterium]